MKDAMDRLVNEFMEMPGLQLTAPQAVRFCGISPALCRVALDGLVDAKFLRVTANGAYARLNDGRFRPVSDDRDESRTAAGGTGHPVRSPI